MTGSPRPGDQATCRRCGQTITWRATAEDAFTHEPVFAWCIAERIPGFGTYRCVVSGGHHQP